jgi:hypothetical protein
MRRRSLSSRLARVALAYLLALQALLGVWAGHAAAAQREGFDPSLTLCRTTAAGESQKSDRDAALPQHCAAMCLSGACASADPPVVVGADVEFQPLRTSVVAISVGHDAASGTLLHLGVSARGPPSIA